MNTKMSGMEKMFDHENNIGIIGHGETVENCFANTARILFTLMSDIDNIHPLQVITFEFEEENTETALATWINLLLTKSREMNIMFSDFHLRREGNLWKANVSGEPVRDEIMHGIAIKNLEETWVQKTNGMWEAKCVLSV